MRARLAPLVIAIVLMATLVRVAATHRLFSPTYDEPAHVFGGYEYLVDGRYTFDTSHPPLARIVFAWPMRDAGAVGHDVRERVGDVFTSTGDYMTGVVTARRGNLLFLAIAILGVAWLAFDLAGPVVAMLATLLFALLPPVLAHGGLATTDIPVTAAFAIAMAVFHRWLRNPSWRWTSALAIALGFGLLTKFSFPVYFTVTAIAMMIAAKRRPIARGIAASAGALVMVWLTYFINRLARFFRGFVVVMQHNAEGHDAYFLGAVRATGWWEYFPVVFTIKTPIPFLLLAAIGAYFVVRERHDRLLLVIAALILLVAMTSRINLGVRHLLPIYVPLSIVAAIGIQRMARTRALPVALTLAGWLGFNSVAAHPDYLPWMNAFAGEHPERIVLDSNFDWGQDVVRLRDTCRELGVTRIGVELFGTTDYRRIGMPETHPIPRDAAAPGWYAVSEGFVIPEQVRDPRAYRWLTEGRTFRRVGTTIRLYRVQ